jgi:hypothetical protein
MSGKRKSSNELDRPLLCLCPDFITMNTMTTETMNTTAPELALKVGYGWFSRSYKTNGHDTHLYLDGTGARVEVSCVTRGTKHETGWDDIVYVGQVFKYVESIKNIC